MWNKLPLEIKLKSKVWYNVVYLKKLSLYDSNIRYKWYPYINILGGPRRYSDLFTYINAIWSTSYDDDDPNRYDFSEVITLKIEYVTKLPKFHDNISNIVFYNDEDENFDGNLENLPKNLKRLILNNNFNSNLDNLPVKLIHLELGNNFNQSIDNIPNTIKYLKLGDSFNYDIENLPNLTTLILPYSYEIDIELPETLKNLTVGEIDVSQIPESVTYLNVNDISNEYYHDLPNIKTLILGKNCQYWMRGFPDSVQHLVLGSNYRRHIDTIPKNIKTIEIHRKYYKPLYLYDKFKPMFDIVTSIDKKYLKYIKKK